MRVLGVDPGSRATGWGLVGGDPATPILVEGGVIRLRAGAPFAVRLHELGSELEQVVARLAPECAAVETPFHGANVRSALQLAHARGVILAVLCGAGIEIAEYEPAGVKRAVTGNGRASKSQVQHMVSRLLRAPEPLEDVDLADAFAVALCHANGLRYRTLLARSGVRP